MNVLVVSTYPPTPCGIGTYAEQQVESLRRQGHTVNVLCPPGGDGDLAGDFAGARNVLRLGRHFWAYDEVCIHFTPSFFFRSDRAASRWATSAAFAALGLAFGRRMRFVIHETDYRVDAAGEGRGARTRLDRLMWSLAGGIEFHTERERTAFAERYGFRTERSSFHTVAHDRHFVARCSMDRAAARRALGLPQDETLFLCIGFVQPHKGFDRAVRAMTRVPAERGGLLRIVGSVRIEWEPALDFARQLHELCALDRRCEFVERFVSDELFDQWILAADYVILPYREIWSSGVAGRAALHGRPLIATRAGGLAEQFQTGSIGFDTDEELAEAIAGVLAAPVAAAAP